MHYDELYSYVGEMGRFQMLACAAIFSFSLLSIDAVNMIFLGADMPHWCAVEPLSVLPLDLQKHLSLPPLNHEGLELVLDRDIIQKELDQDRRVLRHVENLHRGQRDLDNIGQGRIIFSQGYNTSVGAVKSAIDTEIRKVPDRKNDRTGASGETYYQHDSDDKLGNKNTKITNDSKITRPHIDKETDVKSARSRARREVVDATNKLKSNSLLGASIESTIEPQNSITDVPEGISVTGISDVEFPSDAVYSSCEIYDRNYSLLLEEVNSVGVEIYRRGWRNITLLGEDERKTVKCNKWSYDTSTFKSTIISRFDLVCGLEHLNQLSSTLFMTGQVLGGIVSGLVADRFGRKLSMLIFLVVKIGGTTLGALSPQYWVFALGRFILGVGSSACFVNMYILLMELVGPKYRSFAGCGIQVATSVGFMIQPLISMVTRHDVTFQLTYIPANIVVFAVALIVPESPRWLMVVGKYKRADKVFKQMCRINKTKLPEGFTSAQIEKDDAPQGHYALLLKYPRMRLRSIIMNFVWFTSTLIYYAMALNVGYLPGDIFINTLLSATLEVPAIILCLFLLDWHLLGRRGCSVCFFCLTGLCLFLCIPMDLHGYGIAVTALNVIGKAFAVITYSVLFVYASEIFPTEVRNAAMGVAQMFACISSIASPYIGQPMAELWRPLPYVVLGSLSIISGLVCLPLPETFQQPLCDTVTEAEAFTGRKREKRNMERSGEELAEVENQLIDGAAGGEASRAKAAEALANEAAAGGERLLTNGKTPNPGKEQQQNGSSSKPLATDDVIIEGGADTKLIDYTNQQNQRS